MALSIKCEQTGTYQKRAWYKACHKSCMAINEPSLFLLTRIHRYLHNFMHMIGQQSSYGPNELATFIEKQLKNCLYKVAGGWWTSLTRSLILIFIYRGLDYMLDYSIVAYPQKFLQQNETGRNV